MARSEAELRALVALLADETERIAAVAWETLLREREAARPYLLEGSGAPDPRVRGRARLLLEEIRQAGLEDDWKTFLTKADDDLDLEAGCLHLARLHGDVDEQAIRSFLDATAGMVRAHRANSSGLNALGEVLFDNLGFRGGDMERPEHHYLSTVLERRIGIPISLATVYVLVGRRAGLPVSGVAAPERYLARFETPGGPVLVDCFNRGQVYPYEALVNVLSGRGVPQRALAPCSNRFTLYRMLNNLESAYDAAGNERMAGRVRRWRGHVLVDHD